MNKYMDKCFDSGYISVIHNERHLYNNYNFNQIKDNQFVSNNESELSVQSNDCNLNYKQIIDEEYEEMDPNVKQYYYMEVINGKNWFICQFNDECVETELIERAMVSHIKTHLRQESVYNNNKTNDTNHSITDTINDSILSSNCSQKNDIYSDLNEENESTINANNNEINTKMSDRIANFNKTGVYLSDELSCGEQFSDLKQTFEYKSVKRLVESDKQVLKSKALRETNVNSYSRKTLKESDNKNKSNNERKSVICDNNKKQRFIDKTLKTNKRMDNKFNLKTHLKYRINNNQIFMSCKGLQSTRSVEQYFDRKVINDEKVFSCKWNGCYFTTKTKGIAQHIYLRHIGIEFKCNKPNCFKVFRTPMSWREHQKNHICGFGINGKNVVGVCGNENLNKFNERLVIDNKRSFRCKWKGCGAVSAHNKSLKRHIHSQHICPNRIRGEVNRNLKDPIEYEVKVQNVKQKREQSSFESQQNIKDQKLDSNNKFKSDVKQKVKTKTQDKNNTTLSIEKAVQNNRNVSQYIEMKSINGEPHYFCKWKDCKFYDMSLDQMTTHLNEKHIGYKCDERKCNRVFKSRQTLRVHKINHICGFGIEGSKVSEVCNSQNVSKYRDRKVMNGKLMYFCKWKDCEYVSELNGSVFAHIHYRHICPNHKKSVGQRCESLPPILTPYSEFPKYRSQNRMPFKK